MPSNSKMADKSTGLSKLKKGIAAEEKKIASEVKKEGKAASWFFKSHTFKILLSLIIFAALVGAILYYANSQGRIYVEDSEISAPAITLSPQSAGILDKVFVKEGEYISENTIVAQVNGVPIRAKIDGLVISVQDTPGQIVSSQTPVVQMIDPKDLRVVGHVQEDSGLRYIKAGQRVVFTVDAFDKEKFNGIVESVSPIPSSNGIAFSISDKREEKDFDVKVSYDQSLYTQFRNGMSARIWIYK